MYGLAAISAANGWAQAASGATIVMLGLAVLSLIISQIGSIIDLIENAAAKRKSGATGSEKQAPENILPELPYRPLDNLEEAFQIYRLATAESAENFTLPDLHQKLKTLKDPHPHLTVRALRENGLLEAVGEGLYRWKDI